MKMSKWIIALLMIGNTTIVMAADKTPMLERGSCGKIEYPKAALMNEEAGLVVVSVLVASDGSVTDRKSVV